MRLPGRIGAALLPLALAISACTTTGSPVEQSALKGWQTPAGGRGGIYTCSPPACPSLRLAYYERAAFSPAFRGVFESEDPSVRSAFEAELQTAFVDKASAGGNRLRVNGRVQKTSVNGKPGYAFAITGTESDGSRADPGYMILIPDGSTMHMIVAFSETASGARSAARLVANSIQL